MEPSDPVTIFEIEILIWGAVAFALAGLVWVLNYVTKPIRRGRK